MRDYRHCDDARHDHHIYFLIFPVVTMLLVALVSILSLPSMAYAASASLTFTETDDVSGMHSITDQNGNVAYCLDADRMGPIGGHVYTKFEYATGSLAYLAEHIYPATTNIGGHQFGNTTAWSASIMAIYMVVGDATLDGIYMPGTVVEQDWKQSAPTQVEAAAAVAQDALNHPDYPANGTLIWTTDSVGYQRLLTLPNAPDAPSIEVSVTKRWAGEGYQNHLPDSVTVHLKGSDGSDIPLELNAQNGWKGSFSDLKPDVDYTLTEDVVEGFTSHVEGDDSTGFTVTNTYKSPKISIPVEKRWAGAGNENHRPGSVTFRLRGTDGSSRSLVLTEAAGWSGKFDDLPTEDAITGQPISYLIEEADVEGFTPTVSGDQASGFTVTNSYEIPTTSIPVEKHWTGEGYQNHLPDSVTVTLRGTDGSSRQLTLNAGNGWRGEFTDLPSEDAKTGRTITYTLDEVPVEGFETSVTGDQVSGFTVTNSYEIPTTSIPVEKHWTGGNAEGYRPDSVIVHLRGSNGEVRDLTLTASDGWRGTFRDIPLEDSSDGSTIHWELTEDTVKNFTSSVSGSVESGFIVTNTLQTGYGKALKEAGEKSWL